MAVQETGYRRRTRPQAGAPLPAVSPESFGAGLGRTLEAIGERAHRQQLRGHAIERQRTADEEWARFQRDFAVAREEQATVTREARQTGEPGHAERMAEEWRARQEALLEGITEDEVRRRASAQADEWGLRYRVTEADFEEVKRSERIVTDYAETRDISANRIRRLENSDDYLTELELGHGAIDGLNIDVDRKQKLHDEWDQVAAVSFLRGTIDRDPILAKAMLSSEAGLFDHLDPDTVEGLLNSADVEIRRDQAEIEHAANQQKAAFRQAVRVAEEAASQGIDVSEQLPDLIVQASALGMPDVALKLDGIAAESRFAKIYETVTPVQRERRMAELGAKGDKRTADEDRELKWLQDKQGALDSRFNSDPAGFYARTSTPPPPLDFSDPASVAARARWAEAASEATGRPVPPLTRNEAAGISALWDTGQRGDQVQAMDMLALLPPQQAVAAARMVDADPRLAVMVTLPKGYRELALRGRDALKAKSDLLDTRDDPELAEAIAELDRRFGEALGSAPPAQRQAILATGGRIAAGLLDQEGGTLTADLYWKAMNMALGAVGTGGDRRGGLAGWNDAWFVLPDGVTREAFVNGVMAAAREGIGEGRVKPVNPDGSPAALSRAYPVAIGNGIYEFRTRSGAVVRGSDDNVWRIRVPGEGR